MELIILYSLVTAMASTLIELFSPSTIDDLTVPIASTIVIYSLSLVH